MKLPSIRRGCAITSPALLSKIFPEVPKKQFEEQISQIVPSAGPIVYWNAKFTHNGVTGYKVFDGFSRRIHHNSLSNLLSCSSFGNETVEWLVKQFKACLNDDERSRINDQAVSLLNQEEFESFLSRTRQTRHLNPAQSRKIANLSKKLAYYTQVREFKSKKSGKYRMRVAFLTLTAPDGTEPMQVIRAFNHFLDYLQRTANCVYVWKKELGDESERLHFHVLINNFIPYYIISWKWKRLLLAENVVWPLNADGSECNAHTRIELPRNRRQTAHYISKYLSKAYDLPGNYGYISGHSSVLDELKEFTMAEDVYPVAELNRLIDHFKTIRKDYVTVICCDLLKIKEMCPIIGALFEEQYLAFSQRITLPQKFHYV